MTIQRFPRCLRGYRGALTAIVICGASVPVEAQSSATSAVQLGWERALAGKTANTIDDLNTLVQQTCNIAPWQFALRKGRTGQLRLEASSTLGGEGLGCIRSVIGHSKFALER